MKWVGCLFGALALAVLAGAVTALGTDAPTTTYRWVDAQGVVHYSDTPQPGAQKLQIQPAQTYQSMPVAPAAAGSRPGEVPTSSVYHACLFVQPQENQSFFAPEQVAIHVELDPRRRPDDQVAVMLDGHALEPTDDAGLSYQISTPERGAHTLSLSVHDPAGNIVCTASSVFYVQRPSLLSPQSPARGH